MLCVFTAVSFFIDKYIDQHIRLCLDEGRSRTSDTAANTECKSVCFEVHVIYHVSFFLSFIFGADHAKTDCG